MNSFQERIHTYLQQGDRAITKYEKGKALEDLVCYLFESIPGITLSYRDEMNTFETEEIDIAFWNDYHPQGLPSPGFPYIINVECKNWSEKVSSSEVAWFDRKIKDKGLPFGILVAARGITGNRDLLTRSHFIVATALLEQRRLIVITREDMELISDISQFIKLLKEKLCQLIVHQTCFS